ncbi:MAG: PadR family transcriptional regulator [Candidatus Diapherotrites archaeon]|nr:PadR family transcriptional regulator [Candidatus Diapherotrites archaeon]
MQRLREKLSVELLWVYILSILRTKPMHAYALRSEVEKRFDFLPGNVSAYVVLYKLKSRGFVSGKKDGTRTVYSITARGKELLKEAEKELAERQKLIFKRLA